MSTAPTWYPVITVVVALDAFPFRANSVTSVMAVGRQPPRPSPARNRYSPNVKMELENATATVKIEKTITAKIITLRRPR